MAFMKPELWHGGMWICEDSHGESSNFPEDIFSREEAAKHCGLLDPDDVLYEKGWWVRLSAPGYMDATDWSGPFKSKKLALEWFYNFYDVDAEGDERQEGYELDDDLEDEESDGGSLHGAEEDEQGFRMDDDLEGLGQTPRNRKVHNLYQQPDGRWVFRYGPTPYRFENEEKFFPTREAAVRIATKNGWVVQDNNTLRRSPTGGINGMR